MHPPLLTFNYGWDTLPRFLTRCLSDSFLFALLGIF